MVFYVINAHVAHGTQYQDKGSSIVRVGKVTIKKNGIILMVYINDHYNIREFIICRLSLQWRKWIGYFPLVKLLLYGVTLL
jgi:hypothetical protein